MPIYGSLPSRCITGHPRLWTMANKDLMSAKMAPAAGSLPASGSKLLQIAPRSLADLACFSHFSPRMARPVHAYINAKNGRCLPQQVCDAILFHHVIITFRPQYLHITNPLQIATEAQSRVHLFRFLRALSQDTIYTMDLKALEDSSQLSTFATLCQH